MYVLAVSINTGASLGRSIMQKYPGSFNGTHFTLDGVIDRSFLEVFLDRANSSAITTFYPEGVLDTLEVSTAGFNAGGSLGVMVGDDKKRVG